MMASRVIGPNGATAFVPNGDSRADTATLLIASAMENGLEDRHHVFATQGGFFVSDELADLLYEDEDGGVEVRTTEVSGNPGVPHVGVDDEPIEDEESEEEEEESEEEPEDEESEEEESTYDPADDKVDEVKAHVESHPDEAGAILASEKAGKNRSTLVEWLTEFNDNSEEE